MTERDIMVVLILMFGVGVIFVKALIAFFAAKFTYRLYKFMGRYDDR